MIWTMSLLNLPNAALAVMLSLPPLVAAAANFGG